MRQYRKGMTRPRQRDSQNGGWTNEPRNGLLVRQTGGGRPRPIPSAASRLYLNISTSLLLQNGAMSRVEQSDETHLDIFIPNFPSLPERRKLSRLARSKRRVSLDEVRLVCSVHERHEGVSTSEGAERRAFGRTMRRRRSRRTARQYGGHETKKTSTIRRPDCGRQRIQLIRRK